MCFDCCNDEENQTSWGPSQPDGVIHQQIISNGLGESTIVQPSFVGGGGLGESTIVQSSFGGGGGLGESTIVEPSFGAGFDTGGGLGTSTAWSPSQPDGFVTHQEIGGGMGSAVMAQPSYGGGLGSAMMSSPSDVGFVQTQTIGDSGQGQLGQSTYSQNAY